MQGNVFRNLIDFIMKSLALPSKNQAATSSYIPISPEVVVDTLPYRMHNAELFDSIRGPVRTGSVVSALFLLGFCLWAGFAPLSGSVVAGGQVTFADHAKLLAQAIDGGQIEEVYVKDGDRVTQGQPLVRFEDTDAASSGRMIRSALLSMELTAARLQHELLEKDEFIIPDAILMQVESAPELQEIIDNQGQMFLLRLEARKGKEELIQQSHATIEQELVGLKNQLAEEKKRLSYMDTELEGLRDLVKSGYAPRNRLLESESRRSEIMRSISNYDASIAKANEEMLSLDIRMLNLRRDTAQEVERDLIAAREKIMELSEKKRVVDRNISRTVLVAPTDGIVNNMRLTFVGSVVRPGENLMEIIPPDEELTIEAHLPRDHIDAFLGDGKNIHEYGRDGNFVEAKVRLPAFSGRWRKPLRAIVTYVAADTESPNQNGPMMNPGGGTYVIRVKILAEEMAASPDIRLYPGMAAEVFIITGSRTMLSFLFEPILGVLRHSMTG